MGNDSRSKHIYFNTGHFYGFLVRLSCRQHLTHVHITVFKMIYLRVFASCLFYLKAKIPQASFEVFIHLEGQRDAM